mmetsp:Transcript_19754/g.20096  ORF Transcript_19754/g.20096 Transcript_19754/m.20096 type:complete len:116 (+) Transcript_19754:53-400(+)
MFFISTTNDDVAVPGIQPPPTPATDVLDVDGPETVAPTTTTMMILRKKTFLVVMIWKQSHHHRQQQQHRFVYNKWHLYYHHTTTITTTTTNNRVEGEGRVSIDENNTDVVMDVDE